ncbi:MAG: hypothetical protein OSA48_09950 [Akkermansiaceae bacterium]|nr:hypothetical protein [Akkermansiaceae bacterium]|tara:strand:+ start:1470 stop:1811 length:342 start_codon:yes stop_codon:yes gene_type:complete
MTGQTNTDNPSRPILLDAFLPGTQKFDPKFHEGKVITVLIDGSARAIELDPKGRILHQGEDLLSQKSKIWKNLTESPAKLLAQPKPSKAAQQKIADAAKVAKPGEGEAVEVKE